MANILYPPIIDNTVSAFIIEGETYQECEIPFYFQNTGADISTNYVIVKVTNALGVNLLKDDTCKLYSCERSLTSVTTESNAARAQYSVRIRATDLNLKDGSFGYNNRILVSLMTIATNAVIDASEANSLYELSTWVDKNSGLHSVWSEAVARFPIAQPRFAITDLAGLSLDYGSLFLAKEYGIKGNLYFNLDSTIRETDVLAWYEVELIEHDGDSITSIEHSGRLYPNRLTTGDYDLQYIFKYDFNEFTESIPVIPVLGFDENGVPILSTDSYWENESGASGIYAQLDSDTKPVEIIITYATGKGYIGQERYVFNQIIDETLAIDENLKFINDLVVVPVSQQGCMRLNTTIQNSGNSINKGIMVFYKRKKGQSRWDQFYSCACSLAGAGSRAVTRSIVIDDFSAEAGIAYEYRAQFYYEDFVASDEETGVPEHWRRQYASNEVINSNNNILLIEDCFLCTKNLILKVRYNPEISGYKRNVLDSITPTLGGAYPFVRRNGKQIYRTFNLGGLISFNQEVTEYDGQDIFHDSMFINVNNIQDISYENYAALNSVERERVYEKIFREKVIDFLYKDQIILFKSLEEGNIFVRLTGVQFTPNKSLGRMIYSFTAQAVEVLEFNGENYFTYFGDVLEDKIVFRDLYLHTDGEAEFDAVTHTLRYVSADSLVAQQDDSYTLVLYQKADGAYSLQGGQ